jgi:hypothetical protein
LIFFLNFPEGSSWNEGTQGGGDIAQDAGEAISASNRRSPQFQNSMPSNSGYLLFIVVKMFSSRLWLSFFTISGSTTVSFPIKMDSSLDSMTVNAE